jgi:hypothetical protein
MREIYQTIGVDHILPENLTLHFNPRRVPRYPGLQRLIIWTTVKTKLITKRRFPLVLRRLGQKLIDWNSDKGITPPIPTELRGELLSRFISTIDFLEEYLDRPLPQWRDV